MRSKDAQHIIRQRTRPRLWDFAYMTTKAHVSVFLKFKEHLAASKRSLKVLDVGCGYKPFKRMMGGVKVEQYIGVDFDTQRSDADVVGSVEALPLKDNEFDALIATEILEHTLNLDKAVKELRRVSKNGALLYISTPFLLGEHGTPYDFQRITQYKYRDLFKRDEILFMQGTNSNLSTPFFISNVCLENISILKKIPLLPIIYVLNNCAGLLGETLVKIARFLGIKIFKKRKTWVEEIVKSYFYTMPGGYDLIIRIKK